MGLFQELTECLTQVKGVCGFPAAFPLLLDPVYGYQAVNVESQARNATSLLNWTRRLIQVRRTNHAFGRGSITFLRPRNQAVLAFRQRR